MVKLHIEFGSPYNRAATMYVFGPQFHTLRRCIDLEGGVHVGDPSLVTAERLHAGLELATFD